MGQTIPADSQSPGDDPPPAPPPVPRELTSRVTRRAWLEQSVRLWWLIGLAVFVIAACIAGSSGYRWWKERNLIEHGVRIEAEIMGWVPQEDALPRKVLPPDATVDLRYTWEGQTYRPHGGLAGRKEQIFTRTRIPIFIDRAKPSQWTARQKAENLGDVLLGPLLLVPVICVVFAIAILRRRQILGIWRDGEAFCAEVLEVRHSAAAPRSRLVRCAVENGAETRAVKVMLPASKTPRPGDVIWLIAPEGKHTLAIPAALFE